MGKMHAKDVAWDLSSMETSELLSEKTMVFIAKVLAAVCVVAFGPALILDYVPTAKVDVRDLKAAGSEAGRTQRLLLAFAGGGLMAEAALHLLPHLFMPKHHGGAGGDGHEGLGDACTLIAAGFLAAFAIDRFCGVRQLQLQKLHQQQQLEQKEKEKLEEKEKANGAGDNADPAAAAAAAATDATHAAAALAVLSGGGGGEQPEEKKEEEGRAAEASGAPEPESDDRHDYLRTSLAYSTITDDGGSAAGAMIASAYMGQTPPQPRKPPVLSADLPELVEVVPQSAGSTGSRSGDTPDNGRTPPTAAPSSEPPAAAPVVTFAATPELTRYGNPKGDVAATPEEAKAVANGPGGAPHGDDHGDHHDDHDHGPVDAGAYVTLSVDFLHNIIDGIGIGAAYAVGGDVVGHATALLKLVHELQHEIGDVATLVQCGMSKHHAIHVQHTTAAGVFLGAAISLGSSAFPEGLLAACLALSAGATFHLASGTVLGAVLAIPAEKPKQGLLEVAALGAGAAGVVAVGLAESWAGIGH